MIVRFDDLPQFGAHVLVDGAFDPLHSGHVAYLHAARALQYGPLLCAVASDDQIRAKGREPLLPQASRVAVMEALCDAVYAKDRPTEDVLMHMDPVAYVKGSDWQGRLPEAQREVCDLREIPICYVETPRESSTARLRAWALADADRSLDQLTAYMAAQQAIPPDRYDVPYYTGDWRADGDRYTLERRRAIEGRHPLLLRDAFPCCSMLDVGCGPGYLVQFLRELGVDAGGIDPSPAAKALATTKWVIKGYPSQCPSDMADVVICREVLEHLDVSRLCETVRHLFRLAKQYVYITTRHHAGALFECHDEPQVDPTHTSLLTQPFLRALCVLFGGTRRRDLETLLDWQQKGRVLVYAV